MLPHLRVSLRRTQRSGSEPPKGRLTVRQGRGTVSIPHGRQYGSNMRDARAHVVTLFLENSIRKNNFVLHLNVFKCILDYSNKEILDC